MIFKFKQAAKRLFGPTIVGTIQWYTNAPMRDGICGIFNGQHVRLKIFEGIRRQIRLTAIIETGSFRGTTTSYLAATGVPTYTVEYDLNNFAYTRARFRFDRRKVKVTQGDSRDFLRALAIDASVPKNGVFFYLDAHWNEDLPLREELQIILSSWRHSVVMIDDFEVPGTTYGFDDYGPGKRLDSSILEGLAPGTLQEFYPVAAPEEETGRKRGCVVLTWDSDTGNQLRQLEMLTERTINRTGV